MLFFFRSFLLKGSYKVCEVCKRGSMLSFPSGQAKSMIHRVPHSSNDENTRKLHHLPPNSTTPDLPPTSPSPSSSTQNPSLDRTHPSQRNESLTQPSTLPAYNLRSVTAQQTTVKLTHRTKSTHDSDSLTSSPPAPASLVKRLAISSPVDASPTVNRYIFKGTHRHEMSRMTGITAQGHKAFNQAAPGRLLKDVAAPSSPQSHHRTTLKPESSYVQNLSCLLS